MSGFSATIELRSALPPWGVPAITAGLLLAAAAVLISGMALWLRLAVLAALAAAAARQWRALRHGGIAPGIAAIWLIPGGDWRLVLDTGELERAELLRRQGFVTRALVGLTLRADRGARGRHRRLRVWLTPSMLSETDWRRLQVRLRNP
ncbi:MAG: hypothetical protein OXF66_07335 [Gammaproteobacteria bacterium]|nr:hypothetical protein [Gammaproteobacteria bacterium]